MAIKFGRPIERNVRFVPAGKISAGRAARPYRTPAAQPPQRLDAPAGAREHADARRPDLAAVRDRRQQARGRRLHAGRRAAVDRPGGARSRAAAELGIPGLALFPHTDRRCATHDGAEAINADNLVCRAVRAIKKAVPEIGVLCDVALDPYTSHGHDGLLRDGDVLNDETVAMLVQQALVQAEAGCDIIAPSDMMDGRVGAIRAALDDAGLSSTCRSWPMPPNMPPPSTARSATRSAPAQTLTGDKRTYQMDPANGDEALREVALDIAEGADMVMVKPGMPYLDIVRRVKDALRRAHLRLSGVGRIRDALGGRAERLAGPRQRDAGKPARLQARRRRRHPHLFRAARGGEAANTLSVPLVPAKAGDPEPRPPDFPLSRE